MELIINKLVIGICAILQFCESTEEDDFEFYFMNHMHQG